MMPPNRIASLALAVWPALVLAFFALRRGSASPARTTAWMMFLALMFLPANMELKTSGLPFMDKHRLAFLSIAVALQLFHRKDLLARARGHQLPRLLLLACIYGVIQTVNANRDALYFGPTVLPALTDHDKTSLPLAMFLDLYLPFAVGQRIFRTEEDLKDLFEVLGLCALIYMPFFLVELRLSPQFNYWIYGYYQSEFRQAVRGGGYRPMVFMNHGLSVATFLFSAFCASLGLFRLRERFRSPFPGTISAVLAGLLLLSKSLGAIVYAVVAIPLQLLVPRKVLSGVVLALAVVVVAYPVTRASNVFPTARIVEFFERIDPDRAESLAFRFRQEDALAARAMERPVWGWGTFGRNRIWAPWGQDISITDGSWILRLGIYGYFGFAGFFAFLLLPLLRFVWNRKWMAPDTQMLLGTLALMVAAYAVDLLPNGRSDYLSFAFAGALYTLAERGRRPAAQAAPAADRGGTPPAPGPPADRWRAA
jgi:hypothetical protein